MRVGVVKCYRERFAQHDDLTHLTTRDLKPSLSFRLTSRPCDDLPYERRNMTTRDLRAVKGNGRFSQDGIARKETDEVSHFHLLPHLPIS
jgi:hypothetical protein